MLEFNPHFGISEALCQKMNRMENAIGKAKGGGRRMKLVIEKWSDGKYTTWKLKIYYSKVDNIVTRVENNKLRSERHKLEDKLEQISVNVAKLERKVDTASNSAQSYKKKFQKLSQKAVAKKTECVKGPLTKGKHSMFMQRCKERVQRQLSSDCETGLSFLGLHDFVATEVKVGGTSHEKCRCRNQRI